MRNLNNFTLAGAVLAAFVSMAPTDALAQNVACDNDKIPVVVAMHAQDSSAVRKLVMTSPSSVRAQDCKNNGVIHYAVRQRDYTLLSYLVLNDGGVNWKGEGGRAPLAIAVDDGWLEGARVLLTHGAVVDTVDVLDGWTTPLMRAVDRGNAQLVAMLVKFGAKASMLDHRQPPRSAIDRARATRNTAILNILAAQ